MQATSRPLLLNPLLLNPRLLNPSSSTATAASFGMWAVVTVWSVCFSTRPKICSETSAALEVLADAGLAPRLRLIPDPAWRVESGQLNLLPSDIRLQLVGGRRSPPD